MLEKSFDDIKFEKSSDSIGKLLGTAEQEKDVVDERWQPRFVHVRTNQILEPIKPVFGAGLDWSYHWKLAKEHEKEAFYRYNRRMSKYRNIVAELNFALKHAGKEWDIAKANNNPMTEKISREEIVEEARKLFIKKNVNWFKRETWSFQFFKDGCIRLAIAKQHPNDSFCKKTGRIKASNYLKSTKKYFTFTSIENLLKDSRIPYAVKNAARIHHNRYVEEYDQLSAADYINGLEPRKYHA